VDAQRPGALIPGDAEARVRAAGLRSTRQRLTVLDALDAIGGHRTADELVGELVGRGTALPRSTVFNVLDDLVSAGLVLRADLGSGAARYESAAAAGPHHHFVCQICGTIEDVALDRLGSIMVDPDPRFEVESLQVVLRGTCQRCQPGDPHR
jgi:Fe2+ or Zn2+ uptake regulation protein